MWRDAVLVKSVGIQKALDRHHFRVSGKEVMSPQFVFTVAASHSLGLLLEYNSVFTVQVEANSGVFYHSSVFTMQVEAASHSLGLLLEYLQTLEDFTIVLCLPCRWRLPVTASASCWSICKPWRIAGPVYAGSGTSSQVLYNFHHCCGSGMFIPDPNFPGVPDPGCKIFRIPDPDPHQRI